jgi:HK97 family phage major capsid protein
MDDLRSLREQRDELRGRLDGLMEKNDSIDDIESIEALEKGTAEMAELDASIRSAEARAAYEEARTRGVGSYGFQPKSESGASKAYNGEYRFVMNGNEVRIEGRAAGDAASVNGVDPSASLPGMSNATWGDMSAAIPVDLQAELIRLLPNKAVIRQFFQSRQYSNDVELQRVATRVAGEATFGAGTANSVALTQEEAAYPQVSMALERVRVNNFKTAAKSTVTEEFMKDARGRAIAELLIQHNEEHARLWDRGYASGDGGTDGPDPCWEYRAGAGGTVGIEDYIPAAQIIQIDATDAAAAATASKTWVDALAELRYGQLPAQYWGGLRWMTNQVTFAALAKVLDEQGRPLFQPLLTGTPASSLEVGTLLGLPVFVSNNLSGGVTADDTAMILAHQEDYCIFDRTGFSQQVDPYSEADTGEVVYRTRMRSDGRWLRPFAAGAIVWTD